MKANCIICESTSEHAFTARVLGRHDARFDNCPSCGFLQVREPTWLAEAYSSAIASTDTGLVTRNLDIAKKISSVLYGVFGERGERRYVDVAGGYGMLTRLMRDYGFDFYWTDKYCANLMARGFEYHTDIGPAVAVTAIEIMEHLEDPLEFVRAAIRDTGATAFIFTTELFSGVPPPTDWWYYSFETGQHISFFQIRTLEFMAKKLGFNFSSANGLHVFSKNPINAASLKLFTGRLSLLWSYQARRSLGSKMMSDHHKMAAGLRNMQSV